ncbi:pyridine nucleotide-disulfide oxidoreductase/dicluster-binding protein [Geotalea uraniireducens]|uniref:Aldehyde dehydrogenase, iron-sulfur subunit n=1 Tax=Geotalea uraniireducens (strain Rf4) TaxID=351605 RepID=A5GB33_GEOUR|nr:pyridine nucleotide-disulfide oxidoreductase/dicluster-binding protein [Geotalea uraniireducens]ABQ25205.1 aldehyde dehydrogenase, iron-sulfur subunit [Geotalea uraniireducens Rf4]
MEQNKLREWEYKCIQEEPPQCTAGCPIHVDARLFVKQAGQGDWEAALKTLAKTMPFPKILGRVCDHPCEPACKRGEAGEPIAIGALERACVETAQEKVKAVMLPRKDKRVAVIGSGLSSLTVAWDLLRKGYRITVFEPGERLGGTLWEFPETILPPDVITEELSLLESLGAVITLSAQVARDDFIAGIHGEFDAVFVGLAVADLNLHDLELEPLTLATSRKGLFAGGACRKDGRLSPITEAFEGRRAATSIDRYVMNVSMDSGRENEGPFVTRLYTNVEGLEPLPRLTPADPNSGYSTDEAIREAERCIQCECMECVKVCLYLERYKGYPKKYARQVFNNERVIYGAARTKNQFVNSCSTCGLCETVCPNDFFMGDLCLQARRTMNEQKLMPPSFHEFALKDMAHGNGERFALCSHEPGRQESAWLYFPSCQLCATSPGEVLSSYRHLRERLSGGVGIMLRCCGAPAFWAGRDDLFRESLDTVRNEWERLGRPRVVTACSTCRSIFQDHLPEMESVSLWKVIEETGLPGGEGPSPAIVGGTTVAVADPCITRNDPETQGSVRRIVQSLGISIEELPLSGEKPECCGYGGLMYNANPGLARDVIAHRATVSDNDYLAYCAMCRDNFAAAGKRVSHLIELLFPTAPGGDPAARGWISWSERRTNRAKVREGILRELGGKGEGMVEDYEGIVLRMAPEVRKRIDERRILEDDLRRVIDHAERTGKRLENLRTGCYRAYCQTENVTFWVDYTPGEEGFTVHNAYCHRMKIVGVKQ